MLDCFKQKPFAHQLTTLEKCKDRASFGLWLEMGTGKSAIALAKAVYHYRRGEIDTLIVLAPKAVAPNWLEQANTHIPDDVLQDCQIFVWNGDKVGSKSYQDDVNRFIKSSAKLKIITMSYPSVMTEAKPGQKIVKGREFLSKFLKDKSRSCMLVCDECIRIKTPNAQLTKRVLSMGTWAKYRLALTGTPVTNGPFDIFAPIKFLDSEILSEIGCSSFAAFKTRFGVWRSNVRKDNGRSFLQLVSYRDLPILNSIVDRIGCRILKEEVLDLPDKVYSTVLFDLSQAQKELYEKVRDEFAVWLESGAVTAPLAIVRLMRLQQITSGYIPLDPEQCDDRVDERLMVFPENPRLDLLRDMVDDIPHNFIVFAKFTRDIDLILDMMKRNKIPAVRCDGQTSQDDRVAAVKGFQDGTYRAFVANPAAAGEGITLTAAKTVIFYNSTYKLSDRLQAEDRAHRIGQSSSVNYIDIAARKTVDMVIIDALRKKKSLADIITGDPNRDWIQ